MYARTAQLVAPRENELVHLLSELGLVLGLLLVEAHIFQDQYLQLHWLQTMLPVLPSLEARFS